MFSCLTNYSSDVIPNGDLIRLDGFPIELAGQVERKPEEERVVHKLEARIGQRVLVKRKFSTNTVSGFIQIYFELHTIVHYIFLLPMIHNKLITITN